MHSSIDPSLVQECRSILPSILSDPKYIDLGVTLIWVTFHDLYKDNSDRFTGIQLLEIDKNDLFIVTNPCCDCIEFKNIGNSENLWGFAASCFNRPTADIAFSFMSIIRKPTHRCSGFNYSFSHK